MIPPVHSDPLPDKAGAAQASRRQCLLSWLRGRIHDASPSPAERFALLATVLERLPSDAGREEAQRMLDRIREEDGTHGMSGLLRHWYAEKRRMLLGWARRKVGPHLADQVVTDTLSTILVEGVRYRGTASVDVFLRGVLQMKRMEAIREGGRMWQRIKVLDPDTQQWRVPGKLSGTDRAEILTAVRDCVARARSKLDGRRWKGKVPFDGAAFLEAVQLPRGGRSDLASRLGMTPNALTGHVDRTRRLVIECLEAKGIRP